MIGGLASEGVQVSAVLGNAGFPAPPAFDQPGGSFFSNLPSGPATDLGDDFPGLEFRLLPSDQKLETGVLGFRY